MTNKHDFKEFSIKDPKAWKGIRRNPERIDAILAALRDLWKQFPDQRFGQLLDNYVGPNLVDEDDVVYDQIKAFL